MKRIFTYSLLLTMVSVALCACSSKATMTFLCNDDNVIMYVDGDCIGSGMVEYTAPVGTENIRVTCTSEGKEIYNRQYYVKGMKNQLIEINIPKDYTFGSGSQKSKPKH